jgi:hypothetical protein
VSAVNSIMGKLCDKTLQVVERHVGLVVGRPSLPVFTLRAHALATLATFDNRRRGAAAMATATAVAAPTRVPKRKHASSAMDGPPPQRTVPPHRLSDHVESVAATRTRRSVLFASVVASMRETFRAKGLAVWMLRERATGKVLTVGRHSDLVHLLPDADPGPPTDETVETAACFADVESADKSGAAEAFGDDDDTAAAAALELVQCTDHDVECWEKEACA